MRRSDLTHVRTVHHIGTPAEVDRAIVTAHRAGLLVNAQHRRLPDGRAEVWLRLRSDQPDPASTRRWSSPRWLTPGRVALGVGALLAVAACVWGAWQVVSGAGRWAGSNAGWLIPAALVVAAVAGLWATRDRAPRARGRAAARGCAGIAMHCRGCPDHPKGT